MITTCHCVISKSPFTGTTSRYISHQKWLSDVEENISVLTQRRVWLFNYRIVTQKPLIRRTIQDKTSVMTIWKCSRMVYNNDESINMWNWGSESASARETSVSQDTFMVFLIIFWGPMLVKRTSWIIRTSGALDNFDSEIAAFRDWQTEQNSWFSPSSLRVRKISLKEAPTVLLIGTRRIGCESSEIDEFWHESHVLSMDTEVVKRFPVVARVIEILFNM